LKSESHKWGGVRDTAFPFKLMEIGGKWGSWTVSNAKARKRKTTWGGLCSFVKVE